MSNRSELSEPKSARSRILPGFLAAVLVAALAACAADKPPSEKAADGTEQAEQKAKLLFGEGGIFESNDGGIFDSAPADTEATNTLVVNRFLWRAALNTVSFMPLANADPFGGVIITDWYSPPEAPNERFKMNVFILSKTLRVDGLRVAIFREVQANGQWVTADVDAGTIRDIENRILTEARSLRLTEAAAAK